MKRRKNPYSRDNLYLNKYFKSPISAEDVPDYFIMWVRDEYGDDEADRLEVIRDQEGDDEMLASVSEDMKKSYIKWVKQTDYVRGDQNARVSKLHIGKPRLLSRSTWLVHFSANAEDITMSGFEYGQIDPGMLHLTKHLSDKMRKESEGFNFGYGALDISGRKAKEAWRAYSDESIAGAVLFQSAAVQVTHYGDQELQAIFWGPNVSEFILLRTDDGDDWYIEDVNTHRTLVKGDFEKVVSWAISHKRQYEKRIVNHVTPARRNPLASALRVGQIYTKQQTIEHGADGYIQRRAILAYIPLSKIDGREPVPPANKGEPYRKGRPIRQPVEVQYNRGMDAYILHSGNHRVHQAEVNEDRYILAFVESDRGSFGKYIKTSL